MKAKKILYSILLALFALALVLDLAVFLLIPKSAQSDAVSEDGVTEQTESERPSFPVGSGFTMPDGSGFTMPDGSGFTMPDGSDFTLPDGSGFTMPDGSGFTMPDGSGFTMPDRSGFAMPDGFANGTTETSSSESATQTAFPALSARLQAILPAWLWNAATVLRPFWLWILIGAALGIALCVVRLIFLARKSRKQKAEQQPDDDSAVLPARRKTAVWPAILLLLGALVLVAVLFPADSTGTTDEAIAESEVLSASVTRGDVSESLIAAGYLAEQEAEAVTVPSSVEIEAVCVQNGDAVRENQIIGKVNKTSVMVAISAVEEAIAGIDEQLQDAHDAVGKTTLSAPAAGMVKQIYAAVGDNAADVMAEHGSLLLLSLDGRMSVEIPAADSLSTDHALLVTLSDGTVVSGEITDRTEDTVTVSVSDQGYPIGESVFVSDENGTVLGSGTLSVHRPLNITQYLGTVTRLYRNEGASVTAGTVLIGLSDAEDTAEYSTLLSQRGEYEAELKTLFELYQNEVILAPTDGVVSGIADGVPYREASAILSDSAVIRFVSTGPQDAVPSEYVHYAGQVTANEGGTLSLNISMNSVTVTDYTDAAALAGADRSLSGTYTIPASAPVYTYASTWNTMPASEIAAGDLVLFTFDGNGALVWVICYPGAAPTPTPEPTPTPSPTPDPSSRPSEMPVSPNPTGGATGSGGSGGIRLPSGISGGNAAPTPKPSYRIGEQTLLSVTPQQTVTISAVIDELDILSISGGQQVSVYLDAIPGTHFSGAVTEIDTEGTNSGGNTKYTVTVAIARTESMRAGMNATVVVPGESRGNVLLLPLAALCENGNAVTVYTEYDPKTDTLLHPVAVETGVSDGTNVEVLSGLNEGDLYYYRYADSVSYSTGS